MNVETLSVNEIIACKEQSALLSVIVPVYNVEKYLDRCINSIISQTYKNIEVLLVDDGSRDGSSEICDKFAAIYSHIKVIHKLNEGVNTARNLGIDIAKGEYITFIDSDDAYGDTRTLEICMEYLMNDNELDIVQFPMQQINPSEDPIICEYEEPIYYSGVNNILEELTVTHTYHGGTISTAVWDKVFRKSILSNKRFCMTFMEDAYYLLDLIYNIRKVLVQYGGMYLYYQNSGSSMHSEMTLKKKESLLKLYCKTYELLIEFSKNYKFHRIVSCAIINALFWVYYYAGENFDFKSIPEIHNFPKFKIRGKFHEVFILGVVSMFGLKKTLKLFGPLMILWAKIRKRPQTSQLS